MQKVTGSKLFKFTSSAESKSFAELQQYFDQMYFAN
jgi:hypothetical protein